MRIALLGDGLLGKELSLYLETDIFSRKRLNLNIKDKKQLENIISKYDIIINCVAFTDSYSKDFNKHWETNYMFPKVLVELSNRYNKKLIHISTEFVYSMNKKLPNENDEPIPNLSYYSFSKLLADNYIILKSKNYLICRCLHKQKNLFYENVWDVSTSGDSVDKIALLITKLIKNNAIGVFNVGTGTKKMHNIINGEKIISPPKYVPKDTSMDLKKINLFLDENYKY